MLNEHYEGDGAVIYKHVCKFGCEGIVSKRLGSRRARQVVCRLHLQDGIFSNRVLRKISSANFGLQSDCDGSIA